MKKIFGILALMTVFGLGFGMGQYFHDNSLVTPGLAMASAKPGVTMNIHDWSGRSAGTYQWGIFINTDRPIVLVEQKSPTQVAIWTQ